MRFLRHLPALWPLAAGLALGMALGVPLGVTLARCDPRAGAPAVTTHRDLSPVGPLLACGDTEELPNPPRDGLWRAGLVAVDDRCRRQSAAALGAPDAAASGQIPISR